MRSLIWIYHKSYRNLLPIIYQFVGELINYRLISVHLLAHY